MRRKLMWPGNFLLALSLLSLAAAPTAGASVRIPSTLLFQGTTFVDCRLAPGYPYQTTERTSILRGRTYEATGTRMYPWRALLIRGKALFWAGSGSLLENYEGLLGRNLAAVGYAGAGSIVMTSVISGDETILFPEAFFVCQIRGWYLVSGYPVNADTGLPASSPTLFWWRP